MSNELQLDLMDLRRLAADAEVGPATVQRYLAGERVWRVTALRVQRALSKPEWAEVRKLVRRIPTSD
ncbi:MAG TPA: hypothetical protein VGK93_07035 [Candidatus Eisenbacteria bacterium]|jgi:hypothetical protein